ncbi:hypothetical protein CCHR01_16839 [Colletotrichum chrysophilum]|uniref:Uncharacterized protein n=1 Tax=Colletotrichum chrysophilum TaxID=1836956 RepID=A0AAD9A7R0_9PEZI|nr:hypothetical protein CCHR01_16839 [Colletotrichum chrysophilum]
MQLSLSLGFSDSLDSSVLLSSSPASI